MALGRKSLNFPYGASESFGPSVGECFALEVGQRPFARLSYKWIAHDPRGLDDLVGADGRKSCGMSKDYEHPLKLPSTISERTDFAIRQQ